MKIIAIDPGTTKSALCVMDGQTLKPIYTCIEENETLMDFIRNGITCEEEDRACVEMLQSYGNLIGKDVLITAVWIGRFYEVLRRKTLLEPALIYRMEEKMHICHSSKAGDAEIRRALIDRFCTHDFRTGRGTKKDPDFFQGFKADIWAAYAVGLTFAETKMEDRSDANPAN